MNHNIQNKGVLHFTQEGALVNCSLYRSDNGSTIISEVISLSLLTLHRGNSSYFVFLVIICIHINRDCKNSALNLAH